MYIEPNTDIKLYRNIPIDNNYRNTLYFGSVSEQNTFFHNVPNDYLLTTITRASYQRVNKGKLRLTVPYSMMYHCNYIAFRNISFENKWFYAFVNEVEYINNDTCEITFDIDVMQTYRFDVILKPSFVEREHSSIDAIGSNIINEPLDVGEYVYSDYDELYNLGEMCYIIAYVNLESSSTVEGYIYDNIYGGAKLRVYNATDYESINTFLTDFIQRPNAILSIYTCPIRCIIPSDMSIPVGGALISTYKQIGTGRTMFATPSKMTGNERFDGYKPKNKKLYTYPYNYLSIDNGNGSSLPLRYEFFTDAPLIRIDCTITQPVQLIARPSNYKGVEPSTITPGASKTLMNESITLSNFPMCSWNYDAFKSWISQNALPMGLSMFSGMTQGVVKGMSGASRGGLISSQIGAITNLLSETYRASIQADVCRGNTNNANVNVSHNQQKFYKSRVHITGQQAKIIDDYFTMYGYATNEVKVPNEAVRSEWTYTKTIGCNIVGKGITGGLPSETISKLASIYDNGITFWINANNVGNYSLPNEPV